ncbi:MAG TPA: VWA domain-containing protein [Vicinamibacterales bacterium]|nr:VWA domain-containing protein [Vicinamibacterales bacterium]
MRTLRLYLALAVASVAGATLLARPAPSSQPGDDVVAVDAVAVDDNGRAVDDLRQEDFQVREDGRPVALTSFFSSAARGEDAKAGARSVVLLLDDSGVSPRLTSRVQDIARQFVSRTGATDELSVIRLSNRRAEPVSNRKDALAQIDEYRGGAVPFFGRETVEVALTRIATVSRGFDSLQHKRRAIVVIGTPNVFDIDEPIERQSSLIWPYWVRALTAAARANASVYGIDPTGLAGRLRVQRNGIVARTGGASFYNRNDFTAAVQRVWQDTGHYYLLGYTPPRASSNGELHDINVKTTRPGVHVRARRTR